MSDTEIVDWLESEVISVGTHPLGWQFMLEGPDGEPMDEEEPLIYVEDFREACRKAKDWQDGKLGQQREFQDEMRRG